MTLEDATRVVRKNLGAALSKVGSQNVGIHNLCKLDCVCVKSYKERNQSAPSLCERLENVEVGGDEMKQQVITLLTKDTKRKRMMM